MKKDISVRAGVVLQLSLIAVASLSLLAVFAFKVIEITMQRRHVEAAVSVAEVVRKVVREEERERGAAGPFVQGLIGNLSPYVREITILPEGEGPDAVKVTPVGEQVSSIFTVHPTIDVSLPLDEIDAAGRDPRGIRVRNNFV